MLIIYVYNTSHIHTLDGVVWLDIQCDVYFFFLPSNESKFGGYVNEVRRSAKRKSNHSMAKKKISKNYNIWRTIHKCIENDVYFCFSFALSSLFKSDSDFLLQVIFFLFFELQSFFLLREFKIFQ